MSLIDVFQMMIDMIPKNLAGITVPDIDVAGPLKSIFGDDAFSFDKVDIDLTFVADGEEECGNKVFETKFIIDIQNLVWIQPFVIDTLYFEFVPEDAELTAKASISNVEIPLIGLEFRSIYLDVFGSLNPSTMMNSKVELKLIILDLWFLFNLDLYFKVEMSGGIGLSVAISIGEDCHSLTGKPFKSIGYCTTDCQCGPAEGACRSTAECYDGLQCLDVGDQYAMPGKKVCVVVDTWPAISKDAMLGISLYGPSWYNIFDIKIISVTADFDGVIDQIFDFLKKKGEAILEAMKSFGTSLSSEEEGGEGGEAKWDEFKESDAMAATQGNDAGCRRKLDADGHITGPNPCGGRRRMLKAPEKDNEDQETIYVEEPEEESKFSTFKPKQKRFTEEAYAEFEQLKQIYSEQDEDYKMHNLIDCEIFYKRAVECQYMSITHSFYSSQCTVLNLMTEFCYRAQHIVMAENSDKEWHDRAEIEFLHRWVYKLKFEENLRKIDEDALVNECETLGPKLDKTFDSSEDCIQFLLDNSIGFYDRNNKKSVERRELFTGVMDAVSDAATSVADVASDVGGGIVDGVAYVGEQAADGVKYAAAKTAEAAAAAVDLVNDAANVVADLASGALDLLDAAWNQIVAFVEKAAAAIADFAKNMMDSLMSFLGENYVRVNMKGGFAKFLKDQIVDLKIDVKLFGYENSWDLNFCIPINAKCIKRIVDYVWNFLKCVTFFFFAFFFILPD